LNTVEARFHKLINENNMVGEDYRSQAFANLNKVLQLKVFTQKGEQMIGELKTELHHFKKKCARLEDALLFKSQEAEDYLSTILRNNTLSKGFTDQIKELRWGIEDKDEQIRKKDGTIRGRETEIERLKEALQGAADQIEELKEKTQELEMKLIEGEPTPKPDNEEEEKEQVEKEDQEVQTDILMDYFDRVKESRGSKNSRSDG
jgi:chromosome segregation ATPase